MHRVSPILNDSGYNGFTMPEDKMLYDRLYNKFSKLILQYQKGTQYYKNNEGQRKLVFSKDDNPDSEPSYLEKLRDLIHSNALADQPLSNP